MFLYHADNIIKRSEAMTHEQWTWRPAIPAPNSQETASHALAWMISDRMHLEEQPNLHSAKVDIADNKNDLIEQFKREAEIWREWLSKADHRELNKKVKRFGIFPMTKRFFVGHALQNLVYKSGQLSILYFAQGLDGDAPFNAPMPEQILETLEPLFMNPFFAAVVAEDGNRVKQYLAEWEEANHPTLYGKSALHLAAAYDNQELVNVLLGAHADINATDEQGTTALMSAASAGCGRTLRMLLWSGADASILDKAGNSALDHAKESGDPEIISLCESGM